MYDDFEINGREGKRDLKLSNFTQLEVLLATLLPDVLSIITSISFQLFVTE